MSNIYSKKDVGRISDMAFAIILLIGVAIFLIVGVIHSHNEKVEMRYQEIRRQEREEVLRREEKINPFWGKLEQLNMQYKLTEIQDGYKLISRGMFYFEKKTNTTDFFYSDRKRKEYLASKIFAYYDWFSLFIKITNDNLRKYKEYKPKMESLYLEYYPTPNDKADELLRRYMIKEPFFPRVHLFVRKGTYLGYGETRYENRDFYYDFHDIYECVLQKKGKKDFVKEERAKMSDDLRYKVLSRDNFCCVLCGKSRKDGVALEVDHIIPVSKGGRTEFDNLQTLCERCNRGKGNAMPTQQLKVFLVEGEDFIKDTYKPVNPNGSENFDIGRWGHDNKIYSKENDTVGIGSLVGIYDYYLEEEFIYRIVSQIENKNEDEQGGIEEVSCYSPFAQAVYGKRVGQRVVVKGEIEYEIKILSVENNISKKNRKIGKTNNIIFEDEEDSSVIKGMSISHESIKIAQDPISLESPIVEEESSHLGNFIEDGKMTPIDSVAFTRFKEEVLNVWDTFTPREQKVLRLRYGIDDGKPKTLEEVGRVFNVTGERIRQVEAKALRKLRCPSRERFIKDYLNGDDEC